MPRGDHWPHWTERLAARIVVDENGCHIWQGRRNSRGYGMLYFDGKSHLAHRAAWLNAYGEWPDPDKVLDHICEVKACINPAHLRELENHLNIRRAYPRGDAETEARRARWRRANAKRRGNYRYSEGA